MNDIQRFEKRVLQHSEFDDDEGFDENAPGYERKKYRFIFGSFMTQRTFLFDNNVTEVA
jgi:hypothetical protein